MKILVIVPAYNEEASIKYVINKIKNNSGINVDIIVINDASKDKTSEFAKEAGAAVLDLPNNLGIGGAMQTGFKYAVRNNYDIAIQVDGDGQHNPEYIKDIISPVIDGCCDAVIGSRFVGVEKKGFQSSGMRRFGITILSAAIRLTAGYPIKDPTSGFRALNKKVIQLFSEDYPNDYPEPESIVILQKKGLRILETPVVMSERYGGTSSIKKFDAVYYMFKVLLAIIIDCFKYRGAK